MENICGLGGGAFVRRYQITMCKFPARRPDKRVFLGDGGRYENGNEAAPGRSGFPGAGEQHKHVVNSVFLIARGNKQRSRARSSPSSQLFFSARGPPRPSGGPRGFSYAEADTVLGIRTGRYRRSGPAQYALFPTFVLAPPPFTT